MDFSSKISLYDLFAMIIPGGIIMAMILFFCEYCQSYDIIIMCSGCEVVIGRGTSFIEWMIFGVGSYLIGLLNNSIADLVFRYFRNNINFINNEGRRVITENGNINLWKFVGRLFDNGAPLRYNLFSYFRLTFSRSNNPWNHRNYFSAYYALSQRNLLGNIPILEAQIVLIRNIIFPLFFFMWILFYQLISEMTNEWSNSIVYILSIIASLIIIILLFFVMVQRQNKVYRMVWEAANYYNL